MTITVLGASGFIGSKLVAMLVAEGHEVFAPVRGDESIFQRPLGQVYFCIGMTADFTIDPAATFEAHAGVLVRLLAKADFERIVYLSSTRLYDGQADGDEAAPLQLQPNHRRHLYDLTKATGEHFALCCSGGRGSVARLGCVFDDSELATGFVPELLRRLPHERTISLDSSPDAARDYIHIDDTVMALRAIMAQAPGSIYNVASGINVSNAGMASALKALGWEVSFSRPAGHAAAAPRVLVERLAAIGIRAPGLIAYLNTSLSTNP